MTDRKGQIIAAATTLFLEDGVGVSTAKIAKAADVSNGTLFNAFPTKQALIDYIYRSAKIAMFDALPNAGSQPFTRNALQQNWDGYLSWARTAPRERQIMHLLLDAGLVSAETSAEIEARAAPHGQWIQQALEDGKIRGPSAGFVGQLVMSHIDLVITENLDGPEADLAFDMLCASIGVTE